jgi:hypothetical protein
MHEQRLMPAATVEGWREPVHDVEPDGHSRVRRRLLAPALLRRRDHDPQLFGLHVGDRERGEL